MVETKSPANPLFLREEELRQGIELMFYAYRDFTFESDQQLKRYKLGRAHHRALYFIGRHPGQTVGHLLSILKVTKQSISRVLKDLLEQEYVEQKSGPRDRRERRLWLTERGVKLERELTERQSQRFARAYRETGADAVEGFRKVLLGLLDPVERMVLAVSGIAINAHLLKLPYDTVTAFAPVTAVSYPVATLLASPDLPANDLKQLVELVGKEGPEKRTFASPDPGSRLIAERIFEKAGIKLMNIPYKGAASFVGDISAGRVDTGLSSVTSGLSLINAGKLKSLGIMARSASRWGRSAS